MPQTAIQGQQTTQAAIGLAVLVVAAVWWVLASDARCKRVATVLGAGAARPPLCPLTQSLTPPGRDRACGHGAGDRPPGARSSNRLKSESFGQASAARGVERVVEREAVKFKWNECFWRCLPCCLCR